MKSPCEECIALVLCRCKLIKEQGVIKCAILKEWIETFSDPTDNEGWNILRIILKDQELNVIIGDEFCDILPIVRYYRRGKTFDWVG